MERVTINVESDDKNYQPKTLEQISDVYSMVKKFIYKRRFSDSSKQIFSGVSPKNEEHSLYKLISYFGNFNKLSLSRDKFPDIDINFIESAIEAGADVNEVDDYGQTILHDAACNWSTDVVMFLLKHGVNINAMDTFGRTPLHVAATADYPEMVHFLVGNGADMNALTKRELQTPVHYAAKNDSTKSLKALIKLGANYKTVKDYKKRTPLFLAAELDRSESATVLIDHGAPVEERDYCGQTAIIWMAKKMPKIAVEALNTLHIKDKRKRKQEFRLDCLENVKASFIDFSPPSLLKAIVDSENYDFFQCPIVRRFIDIKWRKFGLLNAWVNLIITLLFNILWTVIFFLLPSGNVYKYVYPKNYGITFTWVFALFFLLLIWIVEIQDYRTSKAYNSKWESWREVEIRKDMEFCHPRYPEEQTYWDIELQNTKEESPSYFSDKKNVVDWVVFILLLVCFIIHLIALANQDSNLGYNLKRVYSFALIFLWMRFLMCANFFESLGPFIVILSHTINDIVRFLFIYFIFFIPFYCCFWVFYGGSTGFPVDNERFSANVTKITVQGFDSVRQGIFTLFRISMVDDYDYTNMSSIDPIMSDILIGCWIFATSIICINLLIALLSDTFQRVYDNAFFNAIMQRTKLILAAEESFMYRKCVHGCYKYILKYCNPVEEFFDDDDETDHDLQKVTFIVKDKVEEIYEYIQNKNEDNHKQITDMFSDIQTTVRRMSNDIQRIKRHLRAVHGSTGV